MSSPRSSMTLDLQAGQAVLIGDVLVELVHKSGRAARLRIDAPRQVPIKRQLEGADKTAPGMAQSPAG